MKNTPLDSLVVGVIFTVPGLLIIIFHRAIKKGKDWLDSQVFPVGYGDFWTGKYTRGALIFTYVVIILIGVGFVAIGISSIFGVFTK
jgi:hypothetical protein